MKTIMWLAPCCIVLLIVALHTWRIYRKGLVMALVHLGATLLSAVAAFALTRNFLDPATVDIGGLGESLAGLIPPEFHSIHPGFPEFIRALPTALIALIAFPLLFGILRPILNKIASLLCKPLTSMLPRFPGSGLLAIAVSIVSAILVLMVHLVPLGGISTVASDTLQIAKKVANNEDFTVAADALQGLTESPVVVAIDEMGCRKLFYELTSAKRGEETFSVGEELTHFTGAFSDLIHIFDAIPTDGITMSAENIQALIESLTGSDFVVELTTGLVRSFGEELAGSDAIHIVSQLMDVSENRFQEYFAQISADTLPDDLQTFGDIAAVLSSQSVIPKPGGEFDYAALSDPALMEQVRQIALKNPHITQFFGLE